MNTSSSVATALVQASPCVITPGTTVFVRAGAAFCILGARAACIDPNYALLVPSGARPVLLRAHESAATLVLFREPASEHAAGARLMLVDSARYLEHYCGTPFQAPPVEPRGHDICSDHCARYAHTMQAHIGAAFAQQLSLRDVAQVCALSPYTASRIFHRHVGISLRTYVKRLRLRTALHRIVASGDDLATIALDLGFCDHAHFTHAFRAEFGITPSDFRYRACAG